MSSITTRSGRRKKAYRYGLLGVPSVIIALGWIALWLLWPLRDTPSFAGRSPSRTTVTYVGTKSGDGAVYLKPDLFGRPSQIGFRMPELQSGAGEDLTPSSLLPEPEFDVRKKPVMHAQAGPEEGVKQGKEIVRGEFRPIVGPVKAFSRVPARPAKIVVYLSPELQARGFTFPVSQIEDIKGNETEWWAILSVDVAGTDTVRNVFLEQSSATPSVNARLVRALYRGEVKGNAGVSGRVTVSFCPG